MLSAIVMSVVFVVTTLIDKILFTAFILMLWAAARPTVHRVVSFIRRQKRRFSFWYAAQKQAWQASARRRLIMMLFGPTLVVGI